MAERDREATFLQKLEDKARDKNIKRFSEKSMKWFQRRMWLVFRGSAQRRILNERPTEKRLMPGAMYTYRYNAKWKKELPYWDAFPLIIMIGPVDNLSEPAFAGLNLHYLHPKRRAELMDGLQSTVDDKRYTENARMRFTYQMLRNASQHSAYKPCYKNYLMSYVKSKMVRIDPDEWDAALYLPTAAWQKASKRTVWADSEKKISRGGM